eukprot:6058610-Lingulodinium_polyedra.AAC.1
MRAAHRQPDERRHQVPQQNPNSPSPPLPLAPATNRAGTCSGDEGRRGTRPSIAAGFPRRLDGAKKGGRDEGSGGALTRESHGAQCLGAMRCINYSCREQLADQGGSNGGSHPPPRRRVTAAGGRVLHMQSAVRAGVRGRPAGLGIQRGARRTRVLKRSAPFLSRAALPEVWKTSPRVARSAESV